MTIDSSKARRLASLEEEVQRLRAEIAAEETPADEEIAEQCARINALIQKILEETKKLGEAFRTKKHEPIDLRGQTRRAKEEA